MPYSATTFNTGGAPGINAPVLNTMQTQYTESTLSFNPDKFTAGFVLTGLVASKDGTTANQLDVTLGTAYLLQADGTTRQRKSAASTTGEFTTSTASTTYYLDLNPDGTWSFATSHSGQSNYLPICQVTTDGSGNISTVTDERATTISLFPSAIGALHFPNALGFGTGVGSTYAGIKESSGTPGELILQSSLSGASALGVAFLTWTGSASAVPFSVGGQFASALSYIDAIGDLFAVNLNAKTLTLKPTASNDALILYNDAGTLAAALGYNGSTGYYVYDEIGGGFVLSAGTKSGITFGGDITIPSGNHVYFNGATATAEILWSAGSLEMYYQTPQAGSGNGHLFATWGGSALVTPFGIGTPGGTALCRVDQGGIIHHPNGGTLSGHADFSGTAASGGTAITHGLSAVPNAVSWCPNAGGSESTFGVSAIGSSTVTIHSTGGLAGFGIATRG